MVIIIIIIIIIKERDQMSEMTSLSSNQFEAVCVIYFIKFIDRLFSSM